MQKIKKRIVVFEHQAIKLNQDIDGVIFGENQLRALQNYFGACGVPYFSLIHNGIKFNQYVGVIHVGDLLIEVLPKCDRVFVKESEKAKWRDVLLKMLFAVNIFDIHSPTSSLLNLKFSSILDVYLELFILELELLVHNGLSKKYRKQEDNISSLKGRFLFSKHIQANLIRQERFFVSHNTYDFDHDLNAILYKTLRYLQNLNVSGLLQSRINKLLINFPHQPDIKVDDKKFEKIIYNRKNKAYKKCIEISRLILLQLHPDVVIGKNEVLALMFDMNKLWEKFVYSSLRKHKDLSTTVTGQTLKYFWKPNVGKRSKITPDIVLNYGENSDLIVLDTKWKNLNELTPSADDLRQMYVYHEFFNAKKVALVHPGISMSEIRSGHFLNSKDQNFVGNECAVICLGISDDINKWQKEIHNLIKNWANNDANGIQGKIKIS